MLQADAIEIEKWMMSEGLISGTPERKAPKSEAPKEIAEESELSAWNRYQKFDTKPGASGRWAEMGVEGQLNMVIEKWPDVHAMLSQPGKRGKLAMAMRKRQKAAKMSKSTAATIHEESSVKESSVQDPTERESVELAAEHLSSMASYESGDDVAARCEHGTEGCSKEGSHWGDCVAVVLGGRARSCRPQ